MALSRPQGNMITRLRLAFYNLFIFDEQGRYSHTRFWSSVSYGVATWVIIQLTMNDHITVEYLFSYMAILASHNGASTWLKSRSPINKDTTEDSKG